MVADCDLRPYRVRGWLTRKDDPVFWARTADICDLYLNPPPGAVVLSIDEKTGQVITEPIGRNDSVTFQRFLTMLDTAINPAKQIHVVLDNGSSHVAKATRAWPAAHPRWHVHWTPVHASWLNRPAT